jgi:hypothetical protein
MFDFITKLFPATTKIPKEFPVNNTYIKYGITTTIKMWVKGAFGENKGTRKNAFLGNAASLAGLYHGQLFDEQGTFDGFAAEIIGVDGQPDLSLINDVMTKKHFFKRELLENKQLVNDNINAHSLTSVIYNLLRMYYIKALGHITIDPAFDYYQNGHVSITHRQAFGDFDKATIGQGVEILDAEVTNISVKGDMADEDTTLFYNFGSNVTGTTVAIMRMAHAEWKALVPVGVCHSSPRLTEKFVLYNAHVRGTHKSFDEITAPDIHSCIGDFVRKHGAYRDFQHAYAMITGVLTRPVPRSAEAVVWNTASATVYMPRPTCLRGIAPELYTGQVYVRSPDWQDDYHSWFNSPRSGIPHSVALMEAVYCEMFHMTRLKKHQDIDRENFMAMATGIAECPNTGIMLDTALACMRYGREYEYAYSTTAGVDRMATLPDLAAPTTRVTIVDKRAGTTYDLGEITGVEAPLNVMSFAPVVYPSLSYGINDDGYYLNADQMEVVVPTSDLDGDMVFSDIEKFSKFMSIMRLSGYNVTATRSFDRRQIHNWADNASGRYIYVHDPRDKAPQFIIQACDIRKRENCWLEMPTLYGDVTFGYTLGAKAQIWFSGEQQVRFATGTIETVNRTIYQQAVAKLIQARPMIKITPIHRRSDFHETVLSLPASRPMIAVSSVATHTAQLIDTGHSTATGETAEM